jgi:hypothetical protein
MGKLNNYYLQSYGCNVYVETGTGHGGTLGKAYQHFKRCYSVDVDQKLVINALNAYPNAKVGLGYSTDVLEKWLSSGEFSQEDRILFFLDAHFPGADYRGAAYTVEGEYAVPLQKELELIKKYRPNGRDFIICDDARIYMLGPFEYGNVPNLQVKGGLAFLRDLYPFKNISINFSEEGYIEIDNRVS